MESPTRLLLLRHAEVEARYQRVFGGRIDMNLSPEGQRQARALADYLRDTPFDAIYASPMKRAQQTLAEIRQGRPQEPVILDGLREVDFGSWTGLSWQELFDRHQISAFQWLEHLERGTIAEAECGKTFRARVAPCLEQILSAHRGQTVAVVCHGGVIRMLLSILLELPLPKMTHFDVEYASLTRVLCHDHKSDIDLGNFTPWRDWRPRP